MSNTEPRRQVRYRWRLRELMAARGMFSTTDLVPMLADRGVALSASQVHRLVTGIPERLSLPVLAALCDILDVEPGALIQTEASAVVARATGTHTGNPRVVDLAGHRPTRAVVDARPLPGTGRAAAPPGKAAGPIKATPTRAAPAADHAHDSDGRPAGEDGPEGRPTPR